VRSDLRSRKKSLPVVAALASESDAARDLASLLAVAEPLTEEQLVQAAELVEAAGGKKWVEAEADTALSSAMGCLNEADMPEDVRAEFAAIAEFVTARQW
jgi:geranylgeranyl diphosphate synthase, type I